MIKNQIIKILIAILIILATVAGIDILFGKFADMLFIHSNKSKFSYAVNSQESPEIVIFGSSKAENHYDTPYINDSLKISAFNLGEPGRGLTYHEAAMTSYLKKHSPKTVILDLLPDDLSGRGNNRIKPLYPYIDEFPEIYQVAINVDRRNQFFLKSYLLRYNTEVFEHIKKYRNPFLPTFLGFYPLISRNSHSSLKEKTYNSLGYKIDPIAKKCLIDIIELCKSKKVNFVVVYSPEFYIRNHKLPITEICDSLGVKLIDERLFRSPVDPTEYFYDNRHLNKKGARAFTKRFMEHLAQDSIISPKQI